MITTTTRARNRRTKRSARASTSPGRVRRLESHRRGRRARATSDGLISRSRGRIASSQATTQNTPSAPMTRNGSRQLSGVAGSLSSSTTIGVAIAPSEAPLWRMLLPSGRFAAREQALRRHQRAGPLPGLEESEQHAAGEQLGSSWSPSRSRSRRPTSPAGSPDRASAGLIRSAMNPVTMPPTANARPKPNSSRP